MKEAISLRKVVTIGNESRMSVAKRQGRKKPAKIEQRKV